MIGIDILENFRVEEKSRNDKFVTMYMLESEIEYANGFENYLERITGVFCAKEAIKKAFGCPEKMTMKSIEILHTKDGKPYVVFDESVKDIVAGKVVELSVSHSKTVAVAVAVVLDIDYFSHSGCGCDDCCECESDEDCDCSCDCGQNCQCGENCECGDDCTCDDDCNCNNKKCTCPECEEEDK